MHGHFTVRFAAWYLGGRGGDGLGKALYRVGELARAAGINPRTVDYYTRIGLLRPETRTPSHYRLYSEESLERLRTIQALRARKYSLEEIKAILDRGSAEVLAEAARLEANLGHLLDTLDDLKDRPLDARARAMLTALAVKGMALAQRLLLLLSEEGFTGL
ncbi:MAG TPA: MerR family transcriptional regulator [Thermaerobacter sp.]